MHCSKNLNKYYGFKLVDNLCEELSKLTNNLKKEMQESDDSYPWLDINDERRIILDRCILEKLCKLFMIK